jgi:7-carboxy-7-deazaguanine synthase
MFGKNKKLKPEYSDGKVLKVHSIFKTFQGEGPYVGYPSIFIRLSGCNLACSFCDTEFDSYSEMNVEEIIDKVSSLNNSNNKPLIVITGGEPMRQNISILSRDLIDRDYKIQVESNGTLLCRDLPREVEIVCSPKITNGKYHKIRDDILERVIAIKFIVSANNGEYGDIGNVGQKGLPVYIQPMDEYDQEKNRRNLELAMELCHKHGAILCLQTHKMIGIE